MTVGFDRPINLIMNVKENVVCKANGDQLTIRMYKDGGQISEYFSSKKTLKLLDANEFKEYLVGIGQILGGTSRNIPDELIFYKAKQTLENFKL